LIFCALLTHLCATTKGHCITEVGGARLALALASNTTLRDLDLRVAVAVAVAVPPHCCDLDLREGASCVAGYSEGSFSGGSGSGGSPPFSFGNHHQNQHASNTGGGGGGSGVDALQSVFAAAIGENQTLRSLNGVWFR
jgi:hypothetical protein